MFRTTIQQTKFLLRPGTMVFVGSQSAPAEQSSTSISMRRACRHCKHQGGFMANVGDIVVFKHHVCTIAQKREN